MSQLFEGLETPSIRYIGDFTIHYMHREVLLRLLWPWGARLTTVCYTAKLKWLRFCCTATVCAVSTCLYKNDYFHGNQRSFYFHTKQAWLMTMISFSRICLASSRTQICLLELDRTASNSNQKTKYKLWHRKARFQHGQVFCTTITW